MNTNRENAQLGGLLFLSANFAIIFITYNILSVIFGDSNSLLALLLLWFIVGMILLYGFYYTKGDIVQSGQPNGKRALPEKFI